MLDADGDVAISVVGLVYWQADSGADDIGSTRRLRIWRGNIGVQPRYIEIDDI